MNKIYITLSMFLNILLLIIAFQFYNRNVNLENLVDTYSSYYVPKENYDRVRDKVSDYEWIFQHIVKVENVDTMRMHWCGR